MLPSLARVVLRSRAPVVSARHVGPVATRLMTVRFASGSGSHPHETESFEQFNARYAGFFESCNDLFELQRGLNNCFAYDLVPTVEVIQAALKCARKVNDYATAVRILEGLSVKVENKGQYQQYLDELKPLLEELGINSKEDLYGQKS
ncbi:COX5A, subunit VA of cytochrome c oxidase [Kockovaella imperatae]|uniref:Cytochrome c oxidase subunit 6, mitochondrial n=1 Tax=Kockovaella imperatae TaxID=4999 RepID=A0A1Y1UPR7_9TREE|nr:COX5A, subunit VA of cytochrome c oxidase [Kockovaella imperatae]ORX39962.1 COX5A, subunit VA of cytochrome c oxidase [Kockovaella imperatae]